MAAKANPALFERQLLISNNYADEFDVEGFTVMPERDWEAHVANVTKRFAKLPEEVECKDDDEDFDFYPSQREREVEVGFGTNESVTYSSLDDYLHSFQVSELNAEQYQVLFDLFGEHTDGYSYEYDGENFHYSAPRYHR